MIERINKERKGEMEIEENIHIYLLINVIFFLLKKKKERKATIFMIIITYIHSLTYVAPRGWGVGEERGGKRCLS